MYDGRMHDKLLISDGREAIVGGRNYSDIYFDPQHWWLDFGVLIEGAAVWDLQMNWLKSWAVAMDLSGARHFVWSPETIQRRIRIPVGDGTVSGRQISHRGLSQRTVFPRLRDAAREDPGGGALRQQHGLGSGADGGLPGGVGQGRRVRNRHHDAVPELRDGADRCA